METENVLFNQEVSQLSLSENSKVYLKTTAFWSKLLAIINFIGIGFMVLAGIFMAALSGTLANSGNIPFPAFYSGIGLFYIALAVVLLFPTIYLFRFGKKAPLAVESNDSEILDESLKNMKSYWKFTGIMTITIIALCIVIVPITVIISIASVF